MSRLLGIAFKPVEVANLDGIALALGLRFDVLLFGEKFEFASDAERVLIASLDGSIASDSIDTSLSELARGYSHIAAVSSMAAKDLLPRIAAKLDAAMVTDVSALNGTTTFTRPIQAGSILATVEVVGQPIVLTFRPAGFEAVVSTHQPQVSLVELAIGEGSKIISLGEVKGNRPDLTQAKVVVSGGRPLKNSETFERVIGGFADAFGGAVGATRAAVDSGIAPNESQVGQTGKIVAPDLYVAAGISGSTQHMAGIKDSKLIVAINKDPDAPIFDSADFGLVGDLFEVLPNLQIELKKGR